MTLITFASAGADFYETKAQVKRVGLGRKSSRGARRQLERLKILMRLRRALAESEPDVIVSFIDLTNILTLIAAKRMDVPVIISERTDPRAYRIPLIGRILRRATYPRAAALVVQTSSVAEWAETMVASERVRVIANPVRPSRRDQAEAHSQSLPSGPFVLGVGRLGSEKGFDLLIRAFARSIKDHPEWQLVILGRGSEEKNLRKLARDVGVDSHTQFLGLIREINVAYARGALFVLSSRFEGFPNVLLEAMAAGMPVIAADCRSGPRDIVTHEVDGILVRPNDVGALHRAMERVMSDPELRSRLGSEARRVVDRFSIHTIADAWGELFATALQRHAR